MVASCRLNWNEITVPALREAIDLAERYAAGGASKRELEVMYDTVKVVREWQCPGILAALWPDNRQLTEAVDQFCRIVDDWYRYRQPGLRTRVLALLFRDIIGNPFRPVAFAPDWHTSTTVQLARQMYESRDFTPMPILADALQDAGCEDDAILAHCRDPQATHIRGCWVIDLVLGKA
ncbi:MAG: hypothetical protein JWO38_3143 [Gemmataceae bacterium]|nr:hypothetical protein [Gemmataceae bacterium]